MNNCLVGYMIWTKNLYEVQHIFNITYFYILNLPIQNIQLKEFRCVEGCISVSVTNILAVPCFPDAV